MRVLNLDCFGEVYALCRALVEAKFHSDPTDQDIASSVYVAKISNQVYELMLDELIKMGKEVEYASLYAERYLDSSRREMKFIEEYILSMGDKWERLPSDTREKVIDSLASPYILQDEERTRLLKI